MELLDRYLNTVRPLLPKAQREDIMDELSEEIRSQMEAREVVLDRPLTDDEQGEILARFGHPLLVGGRYQPNQGRLVVGQELIGRELFPFFLKTLKTVLLIGMAGISVVHAVLSIWEPFRFSEFLNAFALEVLIQVGVITGIFSVMQGQLTRHPEKWDSWVPVHEQPEAPSNLSVRVGAVIQLIITGTIFAWIHAMIGPGSAALGPLVLTPVWTGLYWILAAATAISAGQFILTFVRPDAVRYEAGTRVAAIGLWLAGFAYVYQAGTWVTTTDASRVAEVGKMNDTLFPWGILSMIVTLVFALAWEIGSAVVKKRKAG